MKIVVDLRSSSARYGTQEVSDFEEALKIAKSHVSEQSARGVCGYATIRWYCEDRVNGGYYHSAEFTVKSKVSGKFDSNGWPIVESDEIVKSNLFVSVNKGCNIVERIYRELNVKEAR